MIPIGSKFYLMIQPKKGRSIATIFLLLAVSIVAQEYDIQVKTEIDLGQKIEQFRAVPMAIGEDFPNAVAAMYSEDAEIDPNS